MKISEQKNCKLSEQDRLTLATLLIKAGYTVSLGKEKPAGKNVVSHYIEYFTAKDSEHE